MKPLDVMFGFSECNIYNTRTREKNKRKKSRLLDTSAQCVHIYKYIYIYIYYIMCTREYIFLTVVVILLLQITNFNATRRAAASVTTRRINANWLCTAVKRSPSYLRLGVLWFRELTADGSFTGENCILTHVPTTVVKQLTPIYRAFSLIYIYNSACGVGEAGGASFYEYGRRLFFKQEWMDEGWGRTTDGWWLRWFSTSRIRQ
jgi:hypothetical protein